MKRTIRLTESDLHRVIKESIKRIVKEGVGMKKGYRFRETPHISVKPAGKYTGRDPKGIRYHVYVDGAKMFVASLCFSERDDTSGGAFMQKGTYSGIYIDFTTYNKADNNAEAFRKQIGYNSAYDFNLKQAEANVLQIVPYADVHINRQFISIEGLGRFTPESAPYVIQKCVEGLLSPIENNKVKDTDEVTFYDAYDEKEKTMTVKDAYKYAVAAYKDINEYGWGDKVGKPNEYSDIDDCLSDYAEILHQMNQVEFEPPMDWHEMNDRGYFDTFD